MLRIKSKFYNISIICAHAPTEDANEEMKDFFYEQLEKAYSTIPAYDMKLVLGFLLLEVPVSRIVESIFKPDGATKNQIDHVLRDIRHGTNILDMRTMRVPTSTPTPSSTSKISWKRPTNNP